MPTWGYALVAALVAVLGAYVLWPSSGPTGSAAFPAAIAEPFAVTGALGEQRVEGGRVKVAGLDRLAAAEAVAAFAAAAGAVQAAADRVLDGIDAQAARAWGVDGSRRLAVGEEERQWGTADGVGAVWDPRRRRIHLVDEGALRGVEQAAARLDARPLLELPQAAPEWLLVDGVRLARRDGAWRFPGDLRPAATGRVERILAALRAAQLGGADGAPAAAAPLHTLALAGVGEVEERLRLLGLDGRLWLERAGTPAQELVGEAAHLRELIAELASDRPLDPAFAPEPNAVVVVRAGREVLRLGHRGVYGEDGQKPWEVRWSGGAEPAAGDAAQRIQAAVLGLRFRSAARGPEPITPDATAIEIAAEFGAPMRIVLGGGLAHADGWTGPLAELPALLADLRPDACLDPHPCPYELPRLVKLQRRWSAQPERDEVHARAAGGSWARTFPAGATPADAQAVHRLARSIARLQARSVRLATPTERAAPWTAELAVRIAPVKVNMTGAEDEVDLDDTVPRELAWRLRPLAEAEMLYPVAPSWLMVDAVGGLAFTIDAADAEALLADVASTRLFPVAPTLVAAIEVAGAANFRLERRGAAWVLRGDGGERPADALAARRLLRALAALDARAAAEPPAGAGTAIVVETSDGERIAARVHAGPDGAVAVGERGPVALDPGAWSQVALDPAAYRTGP